MCSLISSIDTAYVPIFDTSILEAILDNLAVSTISKLFARPTAKYEITVSPAPDTSYTSLETPLICWKLFSPISVIPSFPLVANTYFAFVCFLSSCPALTISSSLFTLIFVKFCNSVLFGFIKNAFLYFA